MKRFSLVLMLGLCTPVLAADRPQSAVSRNGITPLPPVHGCWCRLPNGQWVWTDVQTTGTANPQTRRVGAATKRHRENFINRTRDGFRPDVVNGIKWFQDGRSYFSD